MRSHSRCARQGLHTLRIHGLHPPGQRILERCNTLPLVQADKGLSEVREAGLSKHEDLTSEARK